jgi:hypothetical protein
MTLHSCADSTAYGAVKDCSLYATNEELVAKIVLDPEPLTNLQNWPVSHLDLPSAMPAAGIRLTIGLL